MTNESSNPDSPEALRLEIERLQYSNDRFRTHLERWRTDVEPLYHAGERSRDMAFQFAQTAIRSMFLLNGGALIAFPAFAELVGTEFHQNIWEFLLSTGGFVLGLVLIVATTLLAYMAMDADAAAIRQRQEIVKIDLNRSHAPEWYSNEVKQARVDAEAAENKSAGLFKVLSSWALALGIGSIAAFLFGAAFAAVVLSSSASANAEFPTSLDSDISLSSSEPTLTNYQ